MSVTLTKLRNNQFIYEDYHDNSLVGFDGTLTSDSCYISNGNVYSGMTIQHVEYTSSDTNIQYKYDAQPVNSLLVIYGLDAKISGLGGGPQSNYNNCLLYIPANKSGSHTFTQPGSKDKFYINRIVI